ncbi:MAG: RNA methyltransferase [Prevotella sp.]|nr:RNA methyltransferase [Prevotella sp.]
MISKNQIKLIRSLELKKNRKREGLFVAEGPKVVGDLLQAGYQPRMLFSTTATERPDAERITEEELRKISFLQHPQEVLAVFEMPTPPLSTLNSQLSTLNSQLSLALDGVQDPGNLGTIIRIADWFGISTIYCSMDTVDVYNPKVVQATMGSLAHVLVSYVDLPTLFNSMPSSLPIYGTLLDGKNIYKQELTQQGIIVMGNEGNGISPEVRKHITKRLLIPDFHSDGLRAESLNVAIATAITCSEFRRRQ